MIGALVESSASAISARVETVCARLAQAARPLSLEEVQVRLPVISLEGLERLARLAMEGDPELQKILGSRFRPRVHGKRMVYRPCDLHDLAHALERVEEESWEDWARRPASQGSLRQGLERLTSLTES
jgi:hypothetical protein